MSNQTETNTGGMKNVSIGKTGTKCRPAWLRCEKTVALPAKFLWPLAKRKTHSYLELGSGHADTHICQYIFFLESVHPEYRLDLQKKIDGNLQQSSQCPRWLEVRAWWFKIDRLDGIAWCTNLAFFHFPLEDMEHVSGLSSWSSCAWFCGNWWIKLTAYICQLEKNL